MSGHPAAAKIEEWWAIDKCTIWRGRESDQSDAMQCAIRLALKIREVFLSNNGNCIWQSMSVFFLLLHKSTRHFCYRLTHHHSHLQMHVHCPPFPRLANIENKLVWVFGNPSNSYVSSSHHHAALPLPSYFLCVHKIADHIII
jgi:hypothetical protein